MWINTAMMNDFANSFVEMVIYICFLFGIGYITMKLVFSVIYWFIKWMAS
jgi:hypothetical protein